MDIAAYCPNLTTFMVDCDVLTDTVLTQIFRGFLLLEEISLCHYNVTADAVIVAMAESCPHLRTVHVKAELSETALVALATHCPELRDISIDSQGTGNLDSIMVDTFFTQLAVGCPHLTDLSVSASADLTEVGWYALATHSHNLRSLKLARCNIRWSPLTPQICFTGAHGLKIGKVNITNAALEMVLRSCPTLLTLKLDSLPGVTEVGYELIGTLCPHLRTVSIPGHACDATLLRISNGCLDLRSLSIVECGAVTEVGLRAVFHYCSLLEELNVSQCPRVTDAVLITLSQHSATSLSDRWPQLRSLNVSHCTAIMDAGVCAVVRANPLLEELDVSHCPGVTDAVLLALSVHSAQLKSVNFNHCSGITTAGVEALKRGCPLLKEMDAMDCKNVARHARYLWPIRCCRP
jgi:hypothetical protein